MSYKVEGIILSKVPVRDRDLIMNILLRTGESLSVFIYGGQGGPKHKSKSLELGHCFHFVLGTPSSKVNSDVYTVKEFKLAWYHQHIRYHFRAFGLLCFICEMAQKMAPKANLEKGHYATDEHEGIFRVVSNALFYVEDALKKEIFHLDTHLTLYLCKLIFELGITPNLMNCYFCEATLNGNKVFFSVKEGAFICPHCVHGQDTAGQVIEEQGSLLRFLCLVWDLKYESYMELTSITSKNVMNSLFKFLCYQYEWSQRDFKSFASLSV